MLESDHVTVDVRYPGAFDAVVCPVCGEKEWTLIPAEGAFCDGCNCHLELGPTNGDPGFIARFDAGHCHPPHWDDAPAKEHLIPEDPEHGRKAYAKFMGGPEDGYGMYWLTIYARMTARYTDEEFEYNDDWRPAWERDNCDQTQTQWSPFFGEVESDDERATPAQADGEAVVVTGDDE